MAVACACAGAGNRLDCATGDGVTVGSSEDGATDGVGVARDRPQADRVAAEKVVAAAVRKDRRLIAPPDLLLRIFVS